ncbi:MAG: MarR family transcriptional regulator [Melioribacteraceae bacterium]|nr:MarR family transcriptional regulator [Melioribacteraceae bacterium]MCO6472914.1 MarR family transcriptional regulator [Melioribacteraceae bacterium]MDD3557206.1 MarR family transcriptional regulator [Melioribacteraceae bacterium]
MNYVALDHLAERMSLLTCEIAKICNKKERQFAASFNLTPAEFRCLKLFTEQDSLPIKTISTELNLTPGRITHILTSLEGKNLIERRIDLSDKRNVIVHLTDASKPFIQKLNLSHIKLHQEIIEEFEFEKQKAIISAMSEVVRALKSWNEKNI